MSITVYTPTPRKLVRQIREGIEAGYISSWIMDDDGDFTHTPPQWRNKAWLTVSQLQPNESVTFGIVSRKYIDITNIEYAVYHGRFTEMLLSHFDTLISDIQISAQPTNFDS